MTVRVAVDFGTSSTCVVVSVNGREPQVVVIDGQPLMSSAVYAASDGTLFVGQEAERQAAVDPSRYEPNPKRRIDEGDLLLGDAVLRVIDVVHAVLDRAVAEARRVAGDAEVDLLVLTHPADWGAIRTRLLRQAAGRLAREVALVPEPVAAAVYHAATFAPEASPGGRTVEFSGRPGDALAVLDLGGGTVDVSVVQRSPEAARAARVPGAPPQRGGFQVLATRGDPSFGGADIDQALLEHVGSLVSGTDPQAWQQLVEGRELADRRRRRVLRQDVRGAKETLSRHTYTDVPLPPPFADAHVTRADLERLIGAPLGRVVELTSAAIADSGLRPKQLAAIFLVGGSSRIPMISRLVHERTGVVPTSLDQPETVVARGALRAVLLEPDRTGVLPGSSIPGQSEHRTEVVRGDAPIRRGLPPVPHAPNPRNAPVPPRGFSPADPARGPQSVPFGAAAPAGASPLRTAPGQNALGQNGSASGGFAVPGVDAPGKSAGKAKKRLWLITAAVAVVALIAGGVVYFVSSGDNSDQGRSFSQYDFSLVAPSDWVQTTDEVADRQVILHPQDAEKGNDLVLAQEFVMDYDATADRQKLVDALRSGVSGNANYTAFSSDLTYGGRTVIGYVESKPERITVRWYVLVQGRIRVHVGCQYQSPAVQQRVDAACEQVVRTLKITS
ncbi:type VII secretion-associated protein [Amycolatopsis echigonensis]|uniref:Chaperone protein HscA n=1 Tax=Amycolatopsis echigonensis TaxID=2576905 RepID=A0A2N3WDY6_9PSEU|nr:MULTISPECIES: type VII secretion-associated protein [Amycolatopsis]MBB2500966.1 type VII secretion-associated protein [Amycolatopsis echigonensis]PKV92073.1 chaperone protein HscA [Amycolatopsis niigatensis]